MMRGPDAWMTVWWLGWLGRRALQRNWEQRRDRWLDTGKTSGSLCRWETDATLWDPVAIRSAEFWMVWAMAVEEREALGN